MTEKQKPVIVVQNLNVREPQPVVYLGVARAWAMTTDDREVLICLPYAVRR